MSGERRRAIEARVAAAAARLEKEGHPYDFIILDPPAFTKARRTVDNAMRGYKEINYRGGYRLRLGGNAAPARKRAGADPRCIAA